MKDGKVSSVVLTIATAREKSDILEHLLRSENVECRVKGEDLMKRAKEGGDARVVAAV